jgi:hypothetical protein
VRRGLSQLKMILMMLTRRLQAEIGELAQHQTHAFDRGMLGHVLLLTSTALVPAILGVSFWLSLSLKVGGGEYFHNNGTYVRPSFGDFHLGGITIKAIGPLLFSSLSSSLMCVSSLLLSLRIY